MANNLRRDTKFYLRRAGIELTAPFNLHAFRKSLAQNHADAGTPPRALARLLGHSNARGTMQYYAQVTDANEQAAAEALNRLFDRQEQSKDAV
jgi:integrase